MRTQFIVFLFLCSISAARSAVAQTLPSTSPLGEPVIGSDPTTVAPVVPPVDWELRYKDAREWIKDFTEWKEWSEHWANAEEPGYFGSRTRRPKPDPPVWLPALCDELIDAAGTLQEACDLLVTWRDDYGTSVLRQQRATARAQGEAVTKTVWWEHIHVDGLWPMTQWGASVYGVIGVHATVGIAHRFQIFVAPGAILMNLPTDHGTREWQTATDFGFSYRLGSFQFPGAPWRSGLHMNFAKAWIMGGPQGFARTSVNLAGFSFTFDKANKTQ
jgi:hypothetical protein